MYPEDNPMSACSRRLGTVCRKTKMCNFFQNGSCRKGSECSFAHDMSELTSAPDLTQTKMCPTVLREGYCSNMRCTFAHKRTEIRKIVFEKFAQAKDNHFFRRTGAAAPGRNIVPPFRSPDTLSSTEDRWSSRTSVITTDGSSTPPISTDGTRGTDDSEGRGQSWICPPNTGGRYYRTKACKFFVDGKCLKGSECTFSHVSNHGEQLEAGQVLRPHASVSYCPANQPCWDHTRDNYRNVPTGHQKRDFQSQRHCRSLIRDQVHIAEHEEEVDIFVQNTFLTIRPLRKVLQSRSSSVPARGVIGKLAVQQGSPDREANMLPTHVEYEPDA